MRFLALLAAAMVFTTASAEEFSSAVEAPEEVLENEETEDPTYIRKGAGPNCRMYLKVFPARVYKKTTRRFKGWGRVSCAPRPFVVSGNSKVTGAAGPTLYKTNTSTTVFKCTRAKVYATKTLRSRVSTYNPFRPAKRC